MSLKNYFGAVVYRRRNELGYTQSQVSEAANIAVRTLQYIERGEHLPKHALMLRLIIILKIDPEIFTEEVEANAPLSRSKRRVAIR